MANLYWAPAWISATSRDHQPFPSLVSGCAVALQLLKVPPTDTLVAFGAHVRNVTPRLPDPRLNGMAPTPGLVDTCACVDAASSVAATTVPAMDLIEVIGSAAPGAYQAYVEG